jgi:hypothetical protein
MHIPFYCISNIWEIVRKQTWRWKLQGASTPISTWAENERLDSSSEAPTMAVVALALYLYLDHNKKIKGTVAKQWGQKVLLLGRIRLKKFKKIKRMFDNTVQ